MKTVMVLGASYLQTFAIKKVKEMGYRAVALDGNPESVGFSDADSSYPCSTTDREGVLAIARKEKIDGIMTYASDVSAPAVAYVAEKLGLPTNPYESVVTMTDKSLTRRFMEKHGFNVPESAEAQSLSEAAAAAEKIGFPVIFKPVDSAGSKGVSRVDSPAEIEKAFLFALDYSRSKRIIVEKFLVRKGHQIDADCFMYDGELVHFLPMDQHRDEIAPYSPIGISAPSVLKDAKAELARAEVERFLKLLGMRFGEYNVEYLFDENDDFYLLEIGPRAGGNLIPDVIFRSAGLDLCRASVAAALGEDCSSVRSLPYKKCVSSYIVHSQRDGEFAGIEYDESIASGVVFEKLFVSPGEKIRRFSGAPDALGFSLIEFSDLETMMRVMDNTADYIRIRTK